MEEEGMQVSGEPTSYVTTHEEEEVVLVWDNGAKQKSIRELAYEKAENIHNEDQDILEYYRYHMPFNLQYYLLFYSLESQFM